MSSRFSRRERVLAAVRGEAVDRVPFSFWNHFRHLEDKAGPEFVQCELAFAERFGVDFLKVMHDIPYELPEGIERLEAPADWERLEVLPPDAGNLGRHLEALRKIRAGLSDDRPMVDTIFNAYAYGLRICGPRLMDHLAEEPNRVRRGLEVVARTLAAFGRRAIEERVLDGVYLAANGAHEYAEGMTPELYREVFLPLDRLILKEAEAGCLNILHIHGTRIWFDLMADLLCHVVGWSDRTTPPSLEMARRRWPERCLMGGIDEVAILERTPEEVADEVRQAIRETQGHRFILASGCAVADGTPEANLWAIAEAVRSVTEGPNGRGPPKAGRNPSGPGTGEGACPTDG